MYKRLRKTKYILLAAMCLSLLVGCGNEKDKTDDKETVATQTEAVSEENSIEIIESDTETVEEELSQQEYIDKYAQYGELGAYKGLEYTETKTEITDEMVQAQVDAFISAYATETKEILVGTTENGDTVNIDFVGSIDGVEFAGGSSGGSGYTLTLGSGTMIEGFEEQIVGHDVGEIFDINVTFPDNYGSEELAGKDAVFEIKINYIVEAVLPDYTDEFVANNTEYETIEEFEQSIRDNLTENYAQYDKSVNSNVLFEMVVQNATTKDIPNEEVNEMVESTISDTDMMADSYGYDMVTYISMVYGMSSEEDFRDYLTEMATEYVKEKIVICAIAKEENIIVSDEEIADYKAMMMEQTGYSDEKTFDSVYTSEDVMYFTLAEKVQSFIVENANPI